MIHAVFYHITMLAVDFILLRSIWQHAPTGLWRLGILSFLGGTAAFVLGMGDCRLISHGWAWHGGGFLLGTAILIGRQKINDKPRIALPRCIFVFSAIYLALCADALLIEPTALEVRHHTIETDKITKPIKILFLSDFQTDVIGKYERRTLLLAKEQQADLILWGGDYIQVKTEAEERKLLIEFNKLLREIDLDAPLGVYAVKGNQEISRWYDWKRSFYRTKIMPVEKTKTVDVGEIRLTLLEMYLSFSKHRITDRNRNGKFRIILGHSPRYALREQDADLLLAGHTHGGQIWIPGFGPLITMTPGLPRRWASGLTELPNGSRLLVTNGTGMERGRAPRVRLFCRPDMRVIHLVPKTGAELYRTIDISPE